MAIQAIGGVSAATTAAPASATAPADSSRRGALEAKDSTIVISKITKTNPDGSTVTTITYADGHTKVETTPPKFAAGEAQGARNGFEAGEGRVTAVDILA
jgi:hypothetical protein